MSQRPEPQGQKPSQGVKAHSFYPVWIVSLQLLEEDAPFAAAIERDLSEAMKKNFSES